MTSQKQIKFILIATVTIILLLGALAVFLVFSQLKKESENLLSQKSRLAAMEAKTESLQEFKEIYGAYQIKLAEINKLYVRASEPIDFIEFLEKEAKDSNLSISIASFNLEKDRSPRSSVGFRLSLFGSPAGFTKLLERLETAPYLVEILNLNAEKDQESPKNIKAVISIKAYSK